MKTRGIARRRGISHLRSARQRILNEEEKKMMDKAIKDWRWVRDGLEQDADEGGSRSS